MIYHEIRSDDYMNAGYERGDEKLRALRHKLTEEGKALLVIMDEKTARKNIANFWDPFQHRSHSHNMILHADKLIIRRDGEERVVRDRYGDPAGWNKHTDDQINAMLRDRGIKIPE